MRPPDQVPRSDGRERSAGGVITSYSIHYTKLYEIREAYIEEMQRDEDVFIMGTSALAGTFPHTQGLGEMFGEKRVLDTPLAEPNMAGCAVITSYSIHYTKLYEGHAALFTPNVGESVEFLVNILGMRLSDRAQDLVV